jgi:superfamily II DNA or RNA helicase
VSRMTQGYVPRRSIIDRLIDHFDLDPYEWLALAGYTDVDVQTDLVREVAEKGADSALERVWGPAPLDELFQRGGRAARAHDAGKAYTALQDAVRSISVVDNIEQKLAGALRRSLEEARAADFCVGYLHLRGWRKVDDLVDRFDGRVGRQARVLVGMIPAPEEELRDALRLLPPAPVDNRQARQRETQLVESLRRQLTFGLPDNATAAGLRRMAGQIRASKLRVRLFLRHALHAKLYLTYAQEGDGPQEGFVGSSNLTAPGLADQGELNLAVRDEEVAEKLRRWFEARWNDDFSRDISDQLAELIERSWAGPEPLSPYLVYLKIAYHLAFDALEAPREYRLPPEFERIVLPFQKEAILRLRRMLRTNPAFPQRNQIALIGDVVGMGKTLTATAVAKMFQDEEGGRVIACCPPKLAGMWRQYLQEYEIAGEVVPYSRTSELREQKGRCRLLVLDESHNLRNRETQMWANIRDFVQDQDAKVLLLSATPYNKHYEDLANQLRLALDDRTDLGLRPESYFRTHSEDQFRSRFQAGPQTLVAFEQSSDADDWRELLRHFMVRRTRGFIIHRYATYDEQRSRYFLTLSDGTRSYFPRRVPITLKFPIREGDDADQYARLFNARVVDVIGRLRLPRYGVGAYIEERAYAEAPKGERELLDNLSRAGQRLLGYCRTNLFKRLESSGSSFLLSLKRHALRNLVYVHALDQGLDLPIGTQDSVALDSADLDTATSDADPEEPAQLEATDLLVEEPPAEQLVPPEGDEATGELRRQAAAVYQLYESGRRAKRRQFSWISSRFFGPRLREDLLADAESLLRIAGEAGSWEPERDAKLNALYCLLAGPEAGSKVLVFSQFADTANYLASELAARGLDHVEAVTASSPRPVDQVRRFSPDSNGYSLQRGDAPIRVLVATEVLSEGQNCQDASVVVNYDLPWAIIRLIQRAGRVDRIGQDNAEIRIYSCLPAEGIDNLISLRRRLLGRLRQNHEVIGTDEQFFEEEAERENPLFKIYTEEDGTYDDPDDTEDVDISSLALGIWEDALKEDSSLEERVKSLPDQVHATREQEAGQGALVYFKTAGGFDSLLKVNREGELVTQSLAGVLGEAACAPDAPLMPTHPEHHALVRAGIEAALREHVVDDGILGSPRSVRRRVYERLAGYRADLRAQRSLFAEWEWEALEKVIDDLYRHPLTQRARDVLSRRLREGISDSALAELAIGLRDDDRLSFIAADPADQEPRLICSIGLFPAGERGIIMDREK